MIFDTTSAKRDDRSAGDGSNPLPPRLFEGTPAPSTVDDCVVVNGDTVVDEAAGDESVGEVSSVVEDSEPVSAGRAYAMPGVVATAAPTPSATASAPT